jgi:hypothetical protein
MHELTLDTDSNTLVLKDELGEERRYRPTAGSAVDLFHLLRDLAAADPSKVVGTLEDAAQLVDPEQSPAEPGRAEDEAGEVLPEDASGGFSSGDIPAVYSRSSNPDSAEDRRRTNQPEPRDYSKGGVFQTEGALADEAIDRMAADVLNSLPKI